MKKIAFLLTLVMTLGLLAGCAGTPVVYCAESNCPDAGSVQQDEQAPVAVAKGAVKTGLAVIGSAKYEWNEQAAALAAFAVGKTVDELKNGAIDESGKAPAGSDLASTATIYLGGYVAAIEKAVANEKHLGAQGGDELRLAVNANVGSSKGATAEEEGLAQLDCDASVVTAKDGVITSCTIDSLQAKVNFDAAGVITTDLSAPM